MKVVSKDDMADKGVEPAVGSEVLDDHRRLWAMLRGWLSRDEEEHTLDSLKLLKAYCDILSQVTKTERIIWGIGEKDLDTEVHDNFEITEAMAQLTLPHGTGKVME